MYRLRNFKRKIMAKYFRETVQIHWVDMRSGVEDDTDTALTNTTRKNSDIPSHAFRVARGMNLVDLLFKCDTTSATCTAKIYVARKDGDIEDVCSVAVVTGAMVGTSGEYYADQLTITNVWYKQIVTSDAAGNDRMAKLKFDILGRQLIFVLLSSVSADEVWSVDISGE